MHYKKRQRREDNSMCLIAAAKLAIRHVALPE